MSDYYSTEKPPKVERLARIEGQSNFLSLLAGVEAGADTTEDMAALAFARSRGAIPEVLEAHVAKSDLYRLPLMSMVFWAIVREYHPKEKDWPWVQGAVADAFMLTRDGKCKPSDQRAKRFKVREETYRTMRNVALGIFSDLVSRATGGYLRAMAPEGESPGCRHSNHVGEKAGYSPLAKGCFRTPPRTGPDVDRGLTLAISGMVDRLGHDARQDRPGPVLTLHGEEAEQYCKANPSQSFRPHSL